jgi:hypothetical protein
MDGGGGRRLCSPYGEIASRPPRAYGGGGEGRKRIGKDENAPGGRAEPRDSHRAALFASMSTSRRVHPLADRGVQRNTGPLVSLWTSTERMVKRGRDGRDHVSSFQTLIRRSGSSDREI